MLTYKPSSFKRLSQESYDYDTSLLVLSLLHCPVCGLCTLIFYGFYRRRIYCDDTNKFFQLKVHRLLCKNCDVTHALLPENILVRSPLSVHDAVLIFSDDDDKYPRLTEFITIGLKERISNWCCAHKINIFTSTASFLIQNLFPFHLYQHSIDRYLRLSD